MIRLLSLKNTFLLSFLFMAACGLFNNDEQRPQKSTGVAWQTAPEPAAQHLEDYLTFLKDKKVAIVANQTSVLKNSKQGYTHLVDTLITRGVAIAKVFAPEHGFRGKSDAGEKVADGTDSKTGLPIISLYGSNKKPAPEQLEHIDLVVFDIQDVGVRFYTYISTLHHVMEACAENNIPVMVLDRPNPNGDYVDGPTLEPEHQSFLGMHPIPLVHGMTIGEYAQMINGEKWLNNGIPCELRVVKMKDYNRSMSYSLPVRPSPNLPNDQSIALYPSLGFFEGTHINAGRGTEFQFQRFGAPFLNQEHFTFEYTPEPNFGAKDPKHKGQVCHGTDLARVNPPKKVDLQWLIEAWTHTGNKDEFFKDRSFTLHAGTEKLRKQIESGMTAEAIRASWQQGIASFLNIRQPYLIYP